ncbi:MAG: glutamine-hydrolyzing GMP synthase [bacterium JZ-2024 1]
MEEPITSQEFVAILDFGSQYSQLIARAVRENRVYSEIFPFSVSAEELRKRKPKGIILSGGPESVYEPGSPAPDMGVYSLGVPILGICYGMQVMAHQLGGKVSPLRKGEYGKVEIRQVRRSALFGDLHTTLVCWMSHGDVVERLPEGFHHLAESAQVKYCAMENPGKKFYGVQFHPEVSHTPWGRDLLRNFLYKICGCQPLWTMEKFAERARESIREQVGKDKVICALSGGVDSTATAVLVYQAVGKQLTGIFVDHGFLRKNEAQEVIQTLRKHFQIPVWIRDAQEIFLKRLTGVRDPEEKRIIIGRTFVEIFEEEAKKIRGVKWLAQGTLYPDVIESQFGTKGPAARIKAHHNVAGLPEKMRLQLLEPFRYLFKDEVRVLALQLGIPKSIALRQPFPGPGLAIRVIGEVTPERLEILREVDTIIVEEIQRAGIAHELWQYFAVLPVVKTVGVMGDKRSYAYPVVLRVVTSRDGMTADWYRIPYSLLERIGQRVLNEVPGVNRFLLDVTSKPPATIEWE